MHQKTMELSTALALIKDGVRIPDANPQIWADLGAGSGLFSEALAALLPPQSTIYAIDQDLAALNSIAWRHADKALVRVNSDINGNLVLPELDGALLANVLHYLPDQRGFLQRLLSQLRPNGVFIIIEYDTHASNRWVPYPVSLDRMKELAEGLRLDILLLGKQRSQFNTGPLYSVLLHPSKTGDVNP